MENVILMTETVFDSIVGPIGIHNIPVDSFQPRMRRVRKYKQRPPMSEVWFGRRCGFQMIIDHTDNIETWIHELSEHATAGMLTGITGKNGLDWRIRHPWDEGRYMEPTIPHLLSSLITHSGVWSDTGFDVIQPEDYERMAFPNIDEVGFDMDLEQSTLGDF